LEKSDERSLINDKKDEKKFVRKNGFHDRKQTKQTSNPKQKTHFTTCQNFKKLIVSLSPAAGQKSNNQSRHCHDFTKKTAHKSQMMCKNLCAEKTHRHHNRNESS
jgi:hypothetical protein